MNKEEILQWLFETYQYTKNFDFNRLNKYEEANDDICIDDLILDYTMLYEFNKETLDKAIDCINYYAIEDEDYSKLYNDEEKELLKILVGFKDKK